MRSCPGWRSCLLVLTMWTATATCSTLVAEPPADELRAWIDARLTPTGGVAPGRCGDAEFLRRVSLDLVGMPPTADEARAFLADSAADKRERWVDRLLASPQHARHLASWLDLTLMERRANTHIPADDWQAWLLRAAHENRPWNVLARELLVADGDDPAQRAAARFWLDRGSEPNLLARDVGRIFFGRDLQCAQCHDHPLVEDYRQADYQGLLAYLAPSYAVVRKEGDKQVTVQAERAGGDLAFESVFFKGTRHRTGPKLPLGLSLDEPFFLPGEEYEVAPADNVKSVPKFSRRARLAELATGGASDAFNRNIVNRLWALMFGRGLVHPLDMQHADNPPVDPILLQGLADRFMAQGYDIKWLLRELALTEAYQRPFDPPAPPAEFASTAAAEVARLELELPVLQQAATAAREAYAQAVDAWQQAEAAALPTADGLDTARNQYGEARKKHDEAARALAESLAQHGIKLTASSLAQQGAAAARQAVAALTEDAELLDASKRLDARAQQLVDEAAGLAKQVEERTTAVKPLEEALTAARPPVETALAAATPWQQTLRQAETAMLDARRRAELDEQAAIACERRLTTARELAALGELEPTALPAATGAALDRWAREFTLSTLRPLTPEQLCWSVFRVTGVYDRYWQAEVAELDKAEPLTDEQRADPKTLATRAVQLEQRTFDKLKGNIGLFVSFYGAGPGQPQGDFFATADQALFAGNGGPINSWVGPAGDNTTERVIKQTDPRLAAEELYLGVLTRLPTDEEAAAVAAHLAARTEDRAVAVQELVWALLNSAEFRFNH